MPVPFPIPVKPSEDCIDQAMSRRELLSWMSAAIGMTGVVTLRAIHKSTEPSVQEFKQFRSALISDLNNSETNFYDTNVELGHLLSRYKEFLSENESENQDLKSALNTFAVNILNSKVDVNCGIQSEEQRIAILRSVTNSAKELGLPLSSNIQNRIEALN